MESIVSALEKVLDQIAKVFKAIVIVLMAFILLWVCIMVVTRYGFSYVPSWGEEITRYAFVFIVFLSLPIVGKSGGHMTIETLTSRLHGNPLKICKILTAIAMVVFSGIMAWYGVVMANMMSYQKTASLQISYTWIYLVIPVGCGMLGLLALIELYHLFHTPAEKIQ
ncbi:MAG: TRAP transporter small permease [Methylobacteriaceae bacterium]|jgi:TRAP-type C4-dicarboxylate transport system permease small subunit|nr:TRAP transporter small permease [Methylobacteriaceae bacterium]